MAITLTKLEKSQWSKVGKVILWLGVSAICAGALALITKNATYLATLPGWNILGVFIQQIFTQEESTALSNVPAPVLSGVNEIAQETTIPL